MKLKFLLIVISIVISKSNISNSLFSFIISNLGREIFQFVKKAGILSGNGYLMTLSMLLSKIEDHFQKLNDKDFLNKWERLRSNLAYEAVDHMEEIFQNHKLSSFLEKKMSELEKKEISTILNEEKKTILTEYIIDYISDDVVERNINKTTHLNILILGKSQIGKTTLIKNILLLKEHQKGAEGGNGTSTTMNDTKYISDILKHIQLIDSRGIETGNFSLVNWTKRYKTEMEKNIKEDNYKDLIHGIWYCVSGNLLNDEELNRIKAISELFNGYRVPIVFVFLKPFEGDIKIVKNRTSQINQNFIVVQSINYTKKCDDEYCPNGDQIFKQYNMGTLLRKTNNLTYEGIVNTFASKISFHIKEEMIKLFEERLKEKISQLKYKIDSLKKDLKRISSPFKIKSSIEKAREDLLEIVYGIIEETLYGKNSKKKISQLSKNRIDSFEKELEDLFADDYKKIQNKIIENTQYKLRKSKSSLHDVEDENSFLGCSDLTNQDYEIELDDLENIFDSTCFISIYSMEKSFEKMYNSLGPQILNILEIGISEIIKDKEMKNLLETKIKSAAEKSTKKLMDCFEEEIKIAFP